MSITPVNRGAMDGGTGPNDRMLRRIVDGALLDAASEQPVDAIVFFKPERDEPQVRSAMNALDAAEALPRGPERRQLVYDSLSTIGTATLDENMPRLQQLQEQGKVQGIDILWSMNAVRLRGASLDAITSIAGDNVRRIVADEIIVPAPGPAAYSDAVEGASRVSATVQEGAGAAAPADAAPDTVWMDWGVHKMEAPAAWQQGITGAGIVIGSLDTGVISDHPGLIRNYRGTRPDGRHEHDYNMWNGVEKGAIYPVDDNGHGTHTIGSAVGYHPNHLIGTAPDATFVHGRGLGNSGGSLFALMAGMEWMLAPTDLEGRNPRPDLAPDIVTNSWGGGPVSNPFLWAQLRNWKRAGIVSVFAAGNDRNAQPGRVAAPGMYGETITVGSSDKQDRRSSFSMYGPSYYANDVKPDVVAPGEYTYSSLPDGTFRDVFPVEGRDYPASGTSMATPHVAGAIALYMQANPGATMDEIAKVLHRSSTQAAAKNDEVGYGRVAIDRLITPETIAPDARRTDEQRVAELMDQVSRSRIYRPDRLQPAGDGGAAAAASPVAAG